MAARQCRCGAELGPRRRVCDDCRRTPQKRTAAPRTAKKTSTKGKPTPTTAKAPQRRSRAKPPVQPVAPAPSAPVDVPPGALAVVAASGDRLRTLEQLRDRIALQLDKTDSARDVAALAQRMVEVLAQIAAVKKLQPAAKGTVKDDVAAKRREREAARKSAAARPRRTAQRR